MTNNLDELGNWIGTERGPSDEPVAQVEEAPAPVVETKVEATAPVEATLAAADAAATPAPVAEDTKGKQKK